MKLGEALYHRIKSFSQELVPSAYKRGGIPAASRGHNLVTGAPVIRGESWAPFGRAWELNPATLPQDPLAFEVTRVDAPEAFWNSKDVEGGKGRKDEGYVLIASSRDESGNIEQNSVKYYAIPKANVPRGFGNAIDGIWATLSSAVGKDRGIENVVACQAERDDVIVTHVSAQADVEKMEVNYDGWEHAADAAERKALIERLCNFPPHLIEKQEIRDGGKTLRLYLNHDAIFTDDNGQETRELFYRDIDISCLGLDAKDVFIDPANRTLNAQMLMPCFTQDFEALGERKKTLLFHASKALESDRAVVSTYKDKDGKLLHVQVKPKTSHRVPAANGGAEVAGAFTNDDEVRMVWVGNTRSDDFKTFAAKSEEDIMSRDDLSPEAKSAAINAFRKAEAFEITGNSPSEIKRQMETIREEHKYPDLEDARVRSDIMETARYVHKMENVEVEPPEKVRPKFVLQYHHKRTSNFKDLLHHLRIPVQPGQSFHITKVKTAATVRHLNTKNGRPTGTAEVIPMSVDASKGDYKNYGLVLYDPREYALFKTGFIPHAIDTCIAGQNLVNPFGPSDEVMAAAWALADQLGFFGVFSLAAMKFPFGRQFSDPANAPWYLKAFGSVFHSLFDAKSCAGQKVWPWTGLPVLKYMAEVAGAAMVTGPNTATPNPARGHLFTRRIPGVGKVVKTGIPGSYILVIEDAELSYFAQTWFGLKTVTTVWPLSCGGGVDNYQLVGVQREMRWNGGIALWLMDGGEEFANDLLRGSDAYHKIHQLITSGRAKALPHIDGLNALLDPASASKAVNSTEKTLLPTPLPKKFTKDEAWQWLAVGTWYYVAFQVFVKYFSVPLLIMMGFLPIPVAGSIFLISCLATTLFSWPFWAMQMAKVGVNPKFIISLRPKHIFWADLFTATMMKTGLDIERMAVGKFRASEKSVGNRMIVADKRMAFWLFGLLPTVAGSVFLLSAIGLTTALGIGFIPLAAISSFAGLGLLVPAAPLIPLALCALPIILGLLGGNTGRHLVSRFLPNPHNRSFGRAFLYWAAGLAPQLVGLGVAWLFVSPLCTVLAFPIITAAMSGGWTLYMGYNMLRLLMHYHKEMDEMPKRGPGQPRPISKTKIDTWRNTLRDAFWREPPRFFPREFSQKQLMAKELWWYIGGQNVDETALRRLPKYKLLKSFLTKYEVIPLSGRPTMKSYQWPKLQKAMEAESLTEPAFQESFGLSCDECNNILMACAASGLLEGILKRPGKDALANLNACIEGEGDGDNTMVIDLALELEMRELPLPSRGRSFRRIHATKAIRDKLRPDYHNGNLRTAKRQDISADDWMRLCECNRMLIEDLAPHCAPRRKYFF